MNTSPTDEFRCTLDNTVNVTDDVTAATLLYSNQEKLMLIIGLGIMLLLGLIGNGVFLLSVYRVQRMRTVTNAYLTNVAISDLIFLIYTVFVAGLTINTIKGGMPLTTSKGCTLIHFFASFPYYLSVTLITFVSLERFFAICLPLSKWSLAGKSRTRNLIAVSWFIGVILSTAWVLTSGKIHAECVIWPNKEQYKEVPTIRWQCDVISNSVAFRVYTINFILLSYAIFLLPILVMYGAIIRALSRRDATTMSEDNRKKEVTEVRNQVARLLIALGTVFFIFQTPSRLSLTIEHLNKLDTDMHLFFAKNNVSLIKQYSSLLLVFNTVINPYLYVVLSKSYRDAYLVALNLKKDT